MPRFAGLFYGRNKIKTFTAPGAAAAAELPTTFLLRQFNNLAPSCGMKTFVFSFIFTYLSRT